MIGRITSHYDLKRKHPVYGTVQPHRGIDLGAPVGIKPHDYIGAPVKAAYAGVVESVCTVWNAGWGAIWGRSGCGVFIRNPDGEGQYYGHLDSVLVRKGEKVTKGQILGGMGVSGNVTGPHLHFECHSKTSGPSNNYTHTRDPMADFRAAGITPGMDPIIIVQSATTATETTAPVTVADLEGLTMAEVDRLIERIGQAETNILAAIATLQKSVGGSVIPFEASNGNKGTTNQNGALRYLLTRSLSTDSNVTDIAEVIVEKEEVSN
nr:M23 family metallopeptidase [Micrococcus sp. TA1]